jgi:phospholipid/cholesterol/gamma-HCH transport system substrate-binding protein
VSANLRGNGPKITAALDGLSRLSEVVTKRRDQLSHLVASTDQVTALLDRRGTQIVELMGQSDTLLRALLARRDLIRGLLRDAASFTDQLRGLLAENEAQFRPLLDNAVQLTDILRRYDDDVDRALELLAPASRYLNNSLGNGPYWDVYLPYSIIPDNIICRTGQVPGCR